MSDTLKKLLNLLHNKKAVVSMDDTTENFLYIMLTNRNLKELPRFHKIGNKKHPNIFICLSVFSIYSE